MRASVETGTDPDEDQRGERRSQNKIPDSAWHYYYYITIVLCLSTKLADKQ